LHKREDIAYIRLKIEQSGPPPALGKLINGLAIGPIYYPRQGLTVSGFVSLWVAIKDIRLNSEADDEIRAFI